GRAKGRFRQERSFSYLRWGVLPMDRGWPVRASSVSCWRLCAAICKLGVPRGLCEIAQSGLLDERVSDVAEFAHALLEARPGEQNAIESGAGQRVQSVDDLLLGADQRKSAPAGDERFLIGLEPLGRDDACIDLERERVDHVPGGGPVALFVHVVAIEV